MPVIIEYSEGAIESIRVIGKTTILEFDWDDIDAEYSDKWNENIKQLELMLLKSKKKSDIVAMQSIIQRYGAFVLGEGDEGED